MITILMLVTLIGNGLAAGVLLSTVLGGVPLLLSLPPARYVHAHGFLAQRYDPFMPVTLAATAVLDVVLAWRTPGLTGQVLYAAAAVTVGTVMVISVTKNVPINKWLISLDPDELPLDWERRDPRYRWRTWNLVRTVLAVTGLLINFAASASALL
ncbi:anthrone oxygenase family protein [Streptosporangium sp. CA-135522]|uniref:anthrone oxygenase family protein n=1 Tax=Streptosporangium sp. CA-135522 TaxID=3240072 RepID=UPI003D8EFE03